LKVAKKPQTQPADAEPELTKTEAVTLEGCRTIEAASGSGKKLSRATLSKLARRLREAPERAAARFEISLRKI
jgi:hypothetical protein